MSDILFGQVSTLDSFTYAGGTGFTSAVRYLYSEDINNDGIKEVIFAGFETQPNSPINFTNSKVSIYGWSEGKFVNLTTKYLPNGADLVDAVGDIAFGDFNKDGLKDIYLSGNADMEYLVHSYAYINQGGFFVKQDLGLTKWEHGLILGDVNNDGYQDIIISGYINPSPVYIGGQNGLTKIDAVDINQNPTWDLNGSGVAFGDFLGDGSRSIIVVDGGSRNGGTNLFRIVNNGKAVSFDYVSSLPAPLLGDASHDIRARTLDFNHDGLDDVLVFSRESWNGTEWPVNSRVQFYVNKGHGVFEDVTSIELVGYDTKSNVSYTPIIEDLNLDGLPDIFLSESSWNNTYNSTTILLAQQNGTYVDSFRTQLSSYISPKGGMASLSRATDGHLYMIIENQSSGGVSDLKIVPLYFPDRELSEKLTGTSKDDHIFGLGGNDVVVGLAGNDIIDGGAGLDTASYTGKKSNFIISATTDGKYMIADKALAEGTDTLINVERIAFSDTNIALDINGNSGTTAKILGAVFGTSSVSNAQFVGIGLYYLDSGMSYQDLMHLALSAKLGAGVNDPIQVVNLLFSNVVGVLPDQTNLNYFVGLLNTHQYSDASLGIMAADTSLNTTNINLVGLAQTGINFI